MDTLAYKYNLGLQFYAVAEKNAERTALRFPDGKELSYSELNSLSNQLARLLLSYGVKQGDVLAIFNDKSEYGYALILACLKTGIIYTNLDYTSPWARIDKILTTCQPSFICFDDCGLHFEAELKKAHPAVKSLNIREEKTRKDISNFSKENLNESFSVHGANPAYLMFTSGSTGFPKGAVMSHSNVLNFIQWGKQTFEVTEADVFTNVNPIYFDNSVFDFYTSIYNGAALVPISHTVAKDARALVKAINDSRCTIWFSVPSLLVYLLTNRALTAADFSSVKRISFGGEGFPKNKLKQLFTLFGERITLFNVYGPTECTCICSSYIISESDFENMNELAPLGFMAPNFGYEILPLQDSNPNLGELALTGPCVGLGYYNDEERSQKSFVQNPTKKYAQRMYKTGDVVERSENGYLHFKGRVDNQIKHMGYRIELEEVEAAFSSLPYINEVGVVYERLSPELGFIKAYVSINTAIETAVIMQDVKMILPLYMLPKTITILDVLPKNSNGKIDRNKIKELVK
ncbi:MAG: amino acid adenylation domain-containing protein [Bacteroidetes bacterium]|nr:amino acid adenylation domain-containing protein [Bacteroidota bacterium]